MQSEHVRPDEMTPAQVAAAAFSGVPVKCLLDVAGALTLTHAAYGDITYRIVPRGDLALTLDRGHPAQKQVVGLIIQQPPGGNCEITWPLGVIWQDGRAPFVDSRPGVLTCVSFTTIDDSALIFGRTWL